MNVGVAVTVDVAGSVVLVAADVATTGLLVAGNTLTTVGVAVNVADGKGV
jgi:hypothetical protein